MKHRRILIIFFLTSLLLFVGLACYRPFTVELTPEVASLSTQTISPVAISSVPALPTLIPNVPDYTPTPDTPHVLPTTRILPEQYMIQAGDTLGAIANAYGIDLNTLVAANPGINANYLEIGQVIQIPAPVPGDPGSDLKLIPDSELIAGPYTVGFDVSSVVNSKNGYLSHYSEIVDEINTSGIQIVERVAQEYSVNPRLLLTVLEYQSGWVTKNSISSELVNYPMAFFDPLRNGLYRQLSWAANNLNRGFYLWDIGGISHWILPNGSLVPVADTINAGTAGIQNLMSLLYNRSDWDIAVGANGVVNTYQQLFGTPFRYSFEPITPTPLIQPIMQLPFENGAVWSFTGGPHAGWGDGSAWAALDFAPPGDALGCVPSDAWVTAVVDGKIIRSDLNVVVIDLNNDGYEQTGWTVLYLHIATQDRISVGTMVKAGDRLGHPSCEGGVANGTHVHIARRYNGKWISADGSTPFVMDGWTSEGTGVEYDGYLVKNDQKVEAWDARKAENQISR
jgi:murein DD-endopeptidase MepM/ murein hydrolase activator NlpD